MDRLSPAPAAVEPAALLAAAHEADQLALATIDELVSAEGDPSAVNRLKAGTQAADLVTADDYMGWVSIDDLVRIFAGAQHDQVNIVPQRLLTSSNISSIPSGGTWSLDGVDYAAKFAELWGK